jgi:hypothetical protein
MISIRQHRHCLFLNVNNWIIFLNAFNIRHWHGNSLGNYCQSINLLVCNFSELLLYAIKFLSTCKLNNDWDNIWIVKYRCHLFIIRSELDDSQIQELFQELIQRLIFYMSINSKQITIKLVVAVRSQSYSCSTCIEMSMFVFCSLLI